MQLHLIITGKWCNIYIPKKFLDCKDHALCNGHELDGLVINLHDTPGVDYALLIEQDLYNCFMLQHNEL
jgi:hypothetical protein